MKEKPNWLGFVGKLFVGLIAIGLFFLGLDQIKQSLWIAGNADSGHTAVCGLTKILFGIGLAKLFGVGGIFLGLIGIERYPFYDIGMCSCAHNSEKKGEEVL